MFCLVYTIVAHTPQEMEDKEKPVLIQAHILKVSLGETCKENENGNKDS